MTMNENKGRVVSVYCAHADAIVPLDRGFCRACSRQVEEDDGVHRQPTPEILKQLGYATTGALPQTEAQGEEESEGKRQKEE